MDPLTSLHYHFTGIVMAVGFDSIKALDDLWEYHRQNKLNDLMHDILITPSALKTANVDDVTLVTKLWDDEYERCKQELMAGTTERVKIADRRKWPMFTNSQSTPKVLIFFL